jgi:rubrerythrin
MAEKNVVVAEFDNAAEAHLARNQLEAASIRAVVVNDEANAANFSVFGRMPYAPRVQVLVTQSLAKRAREVIRSRGKQKLAKNWEKKVEQMDGWLCQLCDTFVEEDVDVCPACAEPRKRNSTK